MSITSNHDLHVTFHLLGSFKMSFDLKKKKNYSFPLKVIIFAKSPFWRYHKWNTYCIFKLCFWYLVLKLIFLVDFIAENLAKFSLVLTFCWAILFAFLCTQSYHLEIMSTVYSFSSLLSFNFFFLVLCFTRLPV